MPFPVLPRSTPRRSTSQSSDHSACSRSVVLRGRRAARLLGPAVGAVTVAGLAACGTSSSAGASATGSSAGVVRVVAGEDFWGDIAQQIGGKHAEVTSIISDPGTDPHEYESDPKDAAAVGRADVVVLNGAGYDSFASKLLEASPRKGRTVVTVADVVHLRGSDPNPHLWYDPTSVREAASAITRALRAADPRDAADFAANEKAFLAAYQPYVDELATIRAEHAGTEISYTERVPGYLVRAAGLELGTPVGFSQSIEDGEEPSASDTHAFDTAIKTGAVKALLYNGQVTDEQTEEIKSLARASGVPVVGVTETVPSKYPDFSSWQIAQAREILAALDR